MVPEYTSYPRTSVCRRTDYVHVEVYSERWTLCGEPSRNNSKKNNFVRKWIHFLFKSVPWKKWKTNEHNAKQQPLNTHSFLISNTVKFIFRFSCISSFGMLSWWHSFKGMYIHFHSRRSRFTVFNQFPRCAPVLTLYNNVLISRKRFFFCFFLIFSLFFQMHKPWRSVAFIIC